MNDPSSWIQDLDAPVRSFRLCALEKSIQAGSTPQHLDALLSRKEAEDDEECRVLLEHAIETVKQRISGQPAAPPPLSEAFFAGDFPALSLDQKLTVLDRLDPTFLRKVAPMAPDLLGRESHPLVRAFLIRKFGRFWPRERLKEIAVLLKSDHLSTRIAVLEALIVQAPDLLSRDLPRFLLHEDPRVRALAVQGLAAIDAEEALLHLEALFDSPQRPHQIAALQNCLFFPFERVKPMLLRLLAGEKDPAMIERVGYFLEQNPDPEVPFRIWEITEQAGPDQEKPLRALLQRACRNIEDSGILGEQAKTYLAKLEHWIKQRSFKRWLQGICQRLENDAQAAAEIEPLIQSRLSAPGLKEALQAALEWPLSDRVKGRLQQWLKGEAAGPAAVSPKPAPADIHALSTPEKIRVVATWGPPDQARVFPALTKMIEAGDTPPDLFAACLRAAERLQIKSFSRAASRGLKIREPIVQQAAIEYLGAFDQESLFPFLGTYLSYENLRVKGAALRVLQRTDPRQGVSSLKAMLGSKNPDQQKAALACMVHFDFSLIRGTLADFLATFPARELADPAWLFFSANPEPENLYALFKLEQQSRKSMMSDWEAKARTLRRENEKILVETGQIDGNQRERSEQFEKRWAEEEAKNTQPATPYSLKALQRSGGATAKASWQEMTAAGIAALKEAGNKHPGLVLLGILLIAGFWALISFDSTVPPPTAKGTAVLATPMTIEGTVKDVQPDGMRLSTAEGKIYLISPPVGKTFPALPPNLEVKAVVTPFRQNEDGSIVCQGISLQKK